MNSTTQSLFGRIFIWRALVAYVFLCSLFLLGSPVQAQIYDPGETMDPTCSPSVLCTVYLGIDVGTTTATGFTTDALVFTNGAGVLQQSPELTFSGNFGLTLDGIMTIASATPATTSESLYNLGGTLYWNGAAVGTIIGGGASNRVAYFSAGNTLTSDPSFVYATSSYGFLGVGSTTPSDLLTLYYSGFAGDDNRGLHIMGSTTGFATSSPTLTFIGTSSSVLMTQYNDRFEFTSPDATLARYQWSTTMNVPQIQLSTDDAIPSFLPGSLLVGSSTQCGGIPGCTNPALSNTLTIWGPGTELLPAMTWGDTLPADSDTGFFKPAQNAGPLVYIGLRHDTFGFTTGGVERIRMGTTSNAMGGNVSFGTSYSNDPAGDGNPIDGRHDSLIVGGLAGNAGLTILDDVGAKFRIGRYAVGFPISSLSLGTTSSRFAWRNNTDTGDIMHLANAGGLLVGPDIGLTGDASSSVHVLTGAASTTNTIRLESEAEQIDWFVVEDNPNGTVIGSPADIAIDVLHGQMYVKRSGVATANNWVAFTVEATSTCSLNLGSICVDGNSFGTSTVVGATNTRNLVFETLGIERAHLTTQGNFNLGTTSSLRRYQIDGQDVLWNGGTLTSLAIGVGAGSAVLVASAINNVLAGNNAGSAMLSADDVVVVGANSFTANTINNGTVLGAGSLTTGTASGNTVIGRGAQTSSLGAASTVTIGSGAAAASNMGSTITIGHYALPVLASSPATQATIGNYAGFSMNTSVSVSNVFLGHFAGYSATSTAGIVAIGNNALYNNGTSSVFGIGHDALYNNTFGFANYAIGHQGLFNTTIGNRNVGIGRYALWNNITGSSSLAIGENAGFTATSSDNNVAIGNSTLYNNASSTNLGIGNFALTNNTYGSLNLAIGHNALFSNTLGTSSMAIGNNALYSATESYDNIAIGNDALYANTTGEHNIAIGLQSMVANTVGSRNIAMGSSSLMSNVTGSDNLAFGLFALENSTVSDNIAFGNNALRETTVGTDNIAFGLNALSSNVSGNNNIAMGKNALSLSVADSDNIALGLSAMIQAVGASSTIAIGANALSGLLTGSNNIGVGSNALAGNTTGQYNIALGADTLFSNTTGSNSIAFGHGVLDAAVSANNIGIGSLALGAVTTGATNTALGAWSLLSLTSGSGNIAVGSSSMSQATSSSDNIIIGSNAATTSIDASHRNIVIGTGIGLAPVASDLLNIGGVVQGFTSTHATPRVGIRNNNPQAVLHVGSTTIADGSTLIRTQDANSTCDFTAQVAAIACGSDRRLKKDIDDDTKGLEEILALRPVQYHWNSEDESNPLHTGFIAQEVEEVLPELVTRREDGIRLLSAGGMMPTVVGAIQDLNERIQNLRTLALGQAQSTTADTTVQNIEITGITDVSILSLSPQYVGRARILAGAQEVHVDFTQHQPRSPSVVVTPRGELKGPYALSGVNESGFTISLEEIQEEDVVFDWHAFVASDPLASAPPISP